MSDEPLEEGPVNLSLDGDVSYLYSVAIQIHEIYLELKNAGFASKDAISIVGNIMSGFFTPDGYYNPNEDWESSDTRNLEDGPDIHLEFLDEDEEEEED